MRIDAHWCASMRIWCASMRLSKNRRMANPNLHIGVFMYPKFGFQILEYAISPCLCVSVTENPYLTGSKSVAPTGVRRQDWQYNVYIVWKVYICFLFLYRGEYDLSGSISPGRHQWDGSSRSSPAGANAITYICTETGSGEEYILIWKMENGKCSPNLYFH